MKEKIKNATILGKTVKPDKAQMLKQVQHDMEVVQGDMEVVQGDMEGVQDDMYGIQDDMGRVQNDKSWLRGSLSGALPDKNFLLLTSHFSPTHFSQRCAFTLAEVLITLGIIGVVAAMTMPTLVAKYEEKATVTKLKKFYSTISQGYLFAVQEYGTPSEWGITGRDAGSQDEDEETYNATNAILIRDRLLKNVKKNKVCNNAKNQKACGVADKIYGVKTSYVESKVSGSSAKTASAGLADGGSVLFLANDGGSEGHNRGSGALAHVYATIYYDVNGIKPPNQYGKDFFMLYLTDQNILPAGTENETYNPFSECYNRGAGCAAWVIYNENMDYLHCPEKLGWDKQHSCKK